MALRPQLVPALVSLLAACACADLTAPQTEASRSAAGKGTPKPATTTVATAQPTATAPPKPTALPQPSGERIGAAHVLVAYKGARRADPKVTRSKAEARKRAEDIVNRAKKGVDFADLAKKFSDGPSGPKGGDLGRFARNAMVKPFADAAFKLKVGEVSAVVETAFGFHVIKRTQ